MTITASNQYQHFLITTQRLGLYLVWNMNGTIQSKTIGDNIGLTFTAVGNYGITVTKSFSENLFCTVISPRSFTLSL